jgi:hypothetical protein
MVQAVAVRESAAVADPTTRIYGNIGGGSSMGGSMYTTKIPQQSHYASCISCGLHSSRKPAVLNGVDFGRSGGDKGP